MSRRMTESRRRDPLRTIAAMAEPFTRLPSVPELPALGQEILEFWQRGRVFDRLREQNAEGPRFSFFDGPVTANKTMGVHTAWGADARGCIPALQGPARLPPALPEWPGLPGDRGSRSPSRSCSA